jgi:hypothetical protein
MLKDFQRFVKKCSCHLRINVFGVQESCCVDPDVGAELEVKVWLDDRRERCAIQ